MRTALAEMFSSKKWLAVFAAIALAAVQGVLTKLGTPLDPTTYWTIQASIGVGVVGQSAADHGKTAAQIAAAAPPGPSSLAIAVAPKDGGGS